MFLKNLGWKVGFCSNYSYSGSLVPSGMCVQNKCCPAFFQFHPVSLCLSNSKLGTVKQHKVDLKMTGHLIRMAVCGK